MRPEAGQYPGVIVGPTSSACARPIERWAGASPTGYAVLVMNPTTGSLRLPSSARLSFRDPATRESCSDGAFPAREHGEDARAALAFLDASGAVDTRHGIGSTGLLLSSSMVFQTAAALPDQVRAGRAWRPHGTDAEDSRTRYPGRRAAT